MSISATTLLEEYLAGDFVPDWCLASVVSKEGSSYRNPGAIMLVNPLGHASGMVSGGCLEMDVIRRCRQVMHDNNARFIEYDMIDEESLAAELGIGCRGKLGIYVQRIDQNLHRLMRTMYAELDAGRSCYTLQRFKAESERQNSSLILLDQNLGFLAGTKEQGSLPPALAETMSSGKLHQSFVDGAYKWSCTRIDPAINIMIFGGGADARPLAKMAAILGWRARIIDHRPAYASARFFPEAHEIIRKPPEDLGPFAMRMDAAIVLTHNLRLDAAWLTWIFSQAKTTAELPSYIGLLGPAERRQRVLDDLSGIDQALASQHVRGPVGVDLGGELPESIALSILADVHAELLSGTHKQLYQQGATQQLGLKSV